MSEKNKIFIIALDDPLTKMFLESVNKVVKKEKLINKAYNVLKNAYKE